MSHLAQKIAGVYVADASPPSAAVVAWVQEECRHGCFSRLISDFARSQPENPDATLALIESISGDTVSGRIPCRITDHESDHPFSVDVHFQLNPVARLVTRRLGEGGVLLPL